MLRWLARWGIRDVVINLHYRPETITALVGDGQAFGTRVRYSWEREILGSAGGPARAMQLHDATTWLIVNADTLTDVDLVALARQHYDPNRLRQGYGGSKGSSHDCSKPLVTMALVPNPDPAKYGGVVVEDQSVMAFTARVDRARSEQSWDEALASSFHFIGVQAVERSALDGVATDIPSSSVGDVYPRLIATRPGSVRAFTSHAAFFDIGTQADYDSTSAALSGKPDWP